MQALIDWLAAVPPLWLAVSGASLGAVMAIVMVFASMGGWRWRLFGFAVIFAVAFAVLFVALNGAPVAAGVLGLTAFVVEGLILRIVHFAMPDEPKAEGGEL